MPGKSGWSMVLALLGAVAPLRAVPADEPDGGAKGSLWSFQPLVEPQLPTVKDSLWPRDHLDRFVLAGLESAGLTPNPDADRTTLIRRAALDLTGLPPSEAEVAAFVADRENDERAFAKVIDHYLASPRFGERWGRHWLDIVRYADSTGRAWNAPFTYAWRYRDYVIDSFNADKPLDRFVLEQLCGDLLPADSLEEERTNQIATGLLALGALDLQSLSHEQFLLDRIDDQIDVVTRGLLGLSIACARCHDHKYDPVTMRDYYALAGIFQSMETWPGVAHQREFGREGYVHPSNLVELPPLPAGEARGGWRKRGIHSMADYQDEWRSGKRDIRYDTDPNLAMGVSGGEIRDCQIRIKGEPYDRGDAPPRGDVRIPGLPRMPPIDEEESGRLALAAWIMSREQPLTARVMANRVWKHLFGEGIVRTVDDFGANSEPPTNRELLDHVALRFREGWSFKRLIRSIMLSRTYRLSSAGQAAALEKDPQNTRYWRMNRRRLEVEAIRDSLLDVAGRLSHERPHGVQVAGTGGKNRRSQAHSLLPLDTPYRTVYLPVIRAGLPEEYATFDFPDPCLLQGQREVTTVAPQALFFLNSRLVVDCARQAARRLLREAKEEQDSRIERAYQMVLRRPPAADETAAALALVEGLEPPADEAGDEYRWAALIQGLMASAEFRYVK